jgi:hypothetical protein
MNDSEDNRQEQVSDIVYDTTNNDYDDDDMSNNKDKEMDADVFFWAARVIMNRSNKNIGTAAMEDRQFRSFFYVRQDINEMVWDILGEGGLHPKKSKPKHLLWALYFMKVYPREDPRCSAVSGSLRVPSTLSPCGNGSGSF